MYLVLLCTLVCLLVGGHLIDALGVLAERPENAPEEKA